MGGNSSGGNGGGDNQKSKAIRKMTQVANYNPAAQKAKGKDYSAPGTGSDPREKDDTAARMDLFYERGATKIKDTASKVPSPALTILSGPLQAGSRKNREFFTEKVLGSKNFRDMSKRQFERLNATQQEDFYQAYMHNRQTGATDAYGNIKSTRDNQGGGSYKDPNKVLSQPKVAAQMDNSNVKSSGITATGPTTAEMSEDERMINVKRRGRRVTTLTDLDTNKKATLSKKVLLG